MSDSFLLPGDASLGDPGLLAIDVRPDHVAATAELPASTWGDVIAPGELAPMSDEQRLLGSRVVTILGFLAASVGGVVAECATSLLTPTVAKIVALGAFATVSSGLMVGVAGLLMAAQIHKTMKDRDHTAS